MGLNPEDPGDRHYRFEAPELKELNHRLDGVLWSGGAPGSADAPLLAATPQVVHSTVLVITPHDRLNLGPRAALRVFLDQQLRLLSLEELSREPDLDPLLNLLTLPTITRCWLDSELAIFGVEPVDSMTMTPASSTTEHKPAPELFTYWREPDGRFLGYLNAYLDHWTLGDDLNDLKDHLLDLYHEFSRDDFPGIRKIGELVVA